MNSLDARAAQFRRKKITSPEGLVPSPKGRGASGRVGQHVIENPDDNARKIGGVTDIPRCDRARQSGRRRDTKTPENRQRGKEVDTKRD